MLSVAILAALVLPAVSLKYNPAQKTASAKDDEDEIVLRVCNWEEYIDEGDWDEEELIELDNGVEIIGETSMVEDFEEWFYETYGKKVRVEYSCFGTNEELYNMLTLGDVYDVVCPSDYMIMKLMAEGKALPFSESFFDESVAENYYVNGVSDYIRDIFDTNEIDGHAWSECAAGYMWGTTGVVYNPEYVNEEDAQSWRIFIDEKYSRRITIKDNVRDSMFAALGIYYSDQLTSDAFLADPNYKNRLALLMNDTGADAIDGCEDILKEMRDVAYSFETDSGKSDMVIGRVWANYQWSGDAVYSLDQAEEDDVELCYAVPEECSNLWFDGWMMLKEGIGKDADKQLAAEAWINFLSRPDNVVRNMYYIGYTSTIAGGDDDTILEYANYLYSAEDDEEEEVVDYDISYFFGEDTVISAPASQLNRQLFAQYPTEDIIRRCAIMGYFDEDTQARVNRMWINVRCYEVDDKALPFIGIGAIIIVIGLMIAGWRKKHG